MSFSDLELEFLSKCPYFIGQQDSSSQIIANVQSELNNVGSRLKGKHRLAKMEGIIPICRNNNTSLHYTK